MESAKIIAKALNCRVQGLGSAERDELLKQLLKHLVSEFQSHSAEPIFDIPESERVKWEVIDVSGKLG